MPKPPPNPWDASLASLADPDELERDRKEREVAKAREALPRWAPVPLPRVVSRPIAEVDETKGLVRVLYREPYAEHMDHLHADEARALAAELLAAADALDPEGQIGAKCKCGRPLSPGLCNVCDNDE